MPGIVGIISDRPAVDCEMAVKSMLASMDHERFYVSRTYSVPEMHVYAGCISHEGSFAAGQPFFNETQGIAILFSGECFLDPDVQTMLARNGQKLRKNGAEWLVQLYELEGDRFFEKLNGVFSGVLIDKRQRKVFLFNDRYGVERIYWHEADGDFYFGSEAKALLKVLPQLREFDNDGVAQFLAFGCTTGTRTLFRGINLFPGGSVWCFEGKNSHKQQYFSPETWESQPRLSNEDFDAAFDHTFKKILPRYFNGCETTIGISLTGGLDTRLIMACLPDGFPDPISYTFTGETGETFDDRIAARIAKACGIKHRLLRIGPDFFADFASHVDRTVYVSDGCAGATAAHEVFFNQQARELAPVRLTGNYGSELFRGISTFKLRRFTPGLFEPEFERRFHYLSESIPARNEHPVTFSAFREIPWSLVGTLLAARSKVVFRTPYLDNEMVALAYRNPEPSSRSPRTALRVIQKGNPVLGRITSDMGFRGDDGVLLARARYLIHRTTFKLDYYYNEAPPGWLAPLEPALRRLAFGAGILGLHKYLHYRSWFREELARYLQQAMKRAQNRQCGFWNGYFLHHMVEDHISGRRNYVGEINAVLTLDAIERLLFKSSLGEGGANTTPASVSSKAASRPSDDQIAQPASLRRSAKDGRLRGWLPTFLGIGSMRCGSTWLYEVLKRHPDIRMSDAKEMDFFFMPQMLEHDLLWYEAHFSPNNGSEVKPVRGEISPRYARLKSWQVNRIARLLPKLRILLTLRHPIERVWSQTLYDFGRLQQKNIRRVSSVEILRQLERARSRLSSDYLRTIEIWTHAFGQDALLISLFDDLRDRPQLYIDQILRHTGASLPWPLPSDLVNKKVWATNTLVEHERLIPEVVEWYIADRLWKSTKRLNEVLQGGVSHWVAELTTIRGKTRLSWRILREVNRTLLSMPEKLAYEGYHLFRDTRFRLRWQKLEKSSAP